MILLVITIALVMGGLLTYSLVEGRRVALNDSRERFRNLAVYLASQLMIDLVAVSEEVNQFRAFIERDDPEEGVIHTFLKSIVVENQRIYGAAAAYEPFGFSKDIEAFAPYYWTQNGELKYEQLGKEQYRYFSKDWYLKPKTLLKPVWTEPYYDEGGGETLMATYASPFLYMEGKQRGEFRGVVTGDVSVDWLTRRLNDFDIGANGFCFLISKKGNFLTKGRAQFLGAKSIFELAEKLGAPEFKSIAGQTLSRESGFMEVGETIGSGPSFIIFSQVPATGWVLGLWIPRDEVFGHVTRMYRTQLIGVLTLLLIMLGVALVAVNSITRPLREIVIATEKVAEGDLDIDLPHSGANDEIGALSRAFERMTVDLKKYIQDLTEITAAKERMESELEIASRIQMSMLPTRFPAYPDRHDFDIYAIMEPAKQVGGDLYDFFLIDDDHLCVAVGDVSDKGVPAALFMAVTIFLIQAAAAKGRGPEEIMEILNEQVSKGNDTCFFVTLFCGILDLRTGEMRFSNAGHEPPLIIRPGEAPADVNSQRSPALGFLPGFEYQSQSLFLKEGDMILAYTDGITEALNRDRQMYTKERLEATIRLKNWKDPESLVESVFTDLAEHVDRAPSFDDLTLLAVQFQRHVN